MERLHDYTALGNTGRRVGRLGFGGATAGLRNYLEPFDPERGEDREQVIAAIRRAYELGVNYFDTAAGYGDGASERIFGEGLAGVDADDVLVATKSGVKDAAGVRRSLETSLKNLRRDRIGLLQIHGTVYPAEAVDAVLRPGGMLDEMEKMRDEGLVDFVGFTCEAQDRQFYRLLDCARFDVVQTCYNLLFQHPYDPGWKCGSFYEMEAAGVGIVTMRSTTSGIFQKWVRRVNPGSAFDYTPSLIAFPLSNPVVDVALVGMRRVEEVERNVALCNDPKSRIDLDDLYTRYV